MINLNFLKNIFLTFMNSSKKEELESFQKRHEIPVTGKEDDLTYRLKELEKEANIEKGAILCNGEFVPIEGVRVVQRLLPANCYKKVKNTRHPTMVVVHWDAALSSKSCWDILANRGISTHFSIDNDGTIYQFADTNDITWHAGPTKDDKVLLSKKNVHLDKSVSWNNMSIGIDISNAYYTKYGSVYEKRGFPKRPVIQSKCHGMKLEHLGYYPEQIESFTKLISVLCSYYDINMNCPRDDENQLITTIYKDACLGKFNGVVNHYNLTTNKIDASGFPLDDIFDNIKDNGEQ